jgi:hypothetical protein
MEITKTEQGTYEATIDGHAYEFAKWGAEAATDTLFDLALVLGKPLAQLGAAMKAGEKGGEKFALSVDVAGSIVEQLIAQMGTNKKLCMDIIRKMTAGDTVMCDGKRITFNTHYQDRLPHMFDVLRAALEVQFGNFFVDVLKGAGLDLVGRTSSAPTAKSTS